MIGVAVPHTTNEFLTYKRKELKLLSCIKVLNFCSFYSFRNLRQRILRLNRPIASLVKREADVPVTMCVIARPAHVPWSPSARSRGRHRAEGKDRHHLRAQ